MIFHKARFHAWINFVVAEVDLLDCPILAQSVSKRGGTLLANLVHAKCQMAERSVDEERFRESLCPLIPYLVVIQLELPQRRIASGGVGDGGDGRR